MQFGGWGFVVVYSNKLEVEALVGATGGIGDGGFPKLVEGLSRRDRRRRMKVRMGIRAEGCILVGYWEKMR